MVIDILAPDSGTRVPRFRRAPLPKSQPNRWARRGLRYARALVCASLFSPAIWAQDLEAPDASDVAPTVSVLRVCVLRPASVSDDRVQEIRDGLQRGADRHDIRVEIPWVREWSRSGFSTKDSLVALMGVPLEAPCDRLLGLIGRNAADFVANVAGFHAPMAFDSATSVRAVIVSNMDPINDALRSPGRNAEFVLQGFLGCRLRLDLFKEECARRVANLRLNVDPQADFVPGVTKKQAFLTTRVAVEKATIKAVGSR